MHIFDNNNHIFFLIFRVIEDELKKFSKKNTMKNYKCLGFLEKF